MPEEELDIRGTFAALAEPPADDNEFSRSEDLRCAEAKITEIHLLKRARPHKPGQACIVHYLRSTKKCANFSETTACTKNTACPYWLANVEYFKKLNQPQNEGR